jgi:Leucine-rich repeat (LRR) protein
VHLNQENTFSPINLESLSLSNNSIEAFTGLEALPHLRVLNLVNNRIKNFKGFPVLPQLEVINLHGNPISEMKQFRVIACGINTSSIQKINNQELTQDEISRGNRYRGVVAVSLREGMTVEDDDDTNIIVTANKYLKAHQNSKTEGTPLSLIQAVVVGDAVEGESMTFIPVFKLLASDARKNLVQICLTSSIGNG